MFAQIADTWGCAVIHQFAVKVAIKIGYRIAFWILPQFGLDELHELGNLPHHRNDDGVGKHNAFLFIDDFL